MSSLRISLLGTFAAHIDEQPIKGFSTAKVSALFAYLAVEHTQPINRGWLAEMLWPDRLEKSARDSFRQALSNLSKTLGNQDVDPPFLLINRKTVQLNPEALSAGIIRIDVADFQHLCEQAKSDLQAAHQAISLYGGPFFDTDLFIDSPEFDQWVQIQRDLLARQMSDLLMMLYTVMLDAGDMDQAITVARKLVEHEPWHEEAHVHLMNALWRDGQASAAMRQYEQCRRLLRDELNVAPSPETVALYEAIRTGRSILPTGMPNESGMSNETVLSVPQKLISEARNDEPTGAPPRHNIPAQAKPFIGRKDELRRIDELFASPDCRQLTIVGPGGMGKTQLALEYARRYIDDSSLGNVIDGVWFVSLVGVAKAEQIPASIIDTLGILMTPDQDPLTRLTHYLGNRTLLLVLDNFEHLRDGALLVADLLAQAPGLKILATSRERLNLQVESVLTLGGLDLPIIAEQNQSVPSSTQSNGESGAVALFIDCACRAEASFVLRSEDRGAVEAICRLTDGMPLGIELAAVWTRLLPCHEILENLNRSIDLLTVSMPDVPARHRSMRVLIQESWHNLSPETQQVFARASIFRGGCDWPALQDVAEASMLHVAELVDRGFLRRMSDGSYQIHELMRQFGAEKLTQSLELEAQTTERHAHYYLNFLAGLEQELISREQVMAAEKISRAIENIRVAWQWAIQKHTSELLASSAAALFKYYSSRGLAHEGAAIFKETAHELALDKSVDEAASVLLIRIRNYMGAFLETLGRRDEGQAMLTENLSQARQQSLTNETGWALLHLGNIIAWNDVSSAEALFEESRLLFQQTEDAEGIIGALSGLWLFIGLRQVDKSSALALAEEALQWARDLEAPLLIATYLARVGNTHNKMGKHAQAIAYTEEALAIAQQLKNTLLEAEILNNMAAATADLGNHEQCRIFLEASVECYQKVGLESGAALTAQENLGRVAQRMGEWKTALAHFQSTAAQSRRANNLFMLGRCHEGMAYTFYKLGDTQQARRELRAAIETKDLWIIKNMKRVILRTLTLILMSEEKFETAAAVFAYKMHHFPPLEDSVVDSDEIETTLRSRLGGTHYHQITQDAPQHDVDELVDAILS